MRDRRYSRYRRDEVFEVIAQQHELLPIDVVPDTATENSVNIRRYQDIHEKDRIHQQVAHGDCSALPPVEKALVAGRSSRWYDHSLNISYYQHGITCIIAATHDSCVTVPVYALDTRQWYEPLRMRTDLGHLDPDKDSEGVFTHMRKTPYGHRMLMGALICDRSFAEARLATLPSSTQARIRAKVERMKTHRRSGPPIRLDIPKGHKQSM